MTKTLATTTSPTHIRLQHRTDPTQSRRAIPHHHHHSTDEPLSPHLRSHLPNPTSPSKYPPTTHPIPSSVPVEKTQPPSPPTPNAQPPSPPPTIPFHPISPQAKHHQTHRRNLPRLGPDPSLPEGAHPHPHPHPQFSPLPSEIQTTDQTPRREDNTQRYARAQYQRINQKNIPSRRARNFHPRHLQAL